ncbi:MAG: hypothetical protein LBO72_00655 [Helicobacteraceae bacterium]|jgi:alpha-tubulin suppressor-like RCC1 family protein|nr:hypothetical protein [Helicobacteraceae bacterium]
MKKALLLATMFLFALIATGCAAKTEKPVETRIDRSVGVKTAEENLTASVAPIAPIVEAIEIDANETIGVIAKLAFGERHTLALDIDGGVWASGLNNRGQLGAGDFVTKSRFYSFIIFERIKSLKGKKIVAIAAGYDQSFAIDNDGGVWASGRNDYGQLGAGDFDDRNVFTKVESLSGVKIKAIAIGKQHTIALDSGGKVWVAGANSLGQLGLDDVDSKNVFVKTAFINDATITAIAAGRYHSVALDSRGAIFSCGSDGYGQLGLGAGGAGMVVARFTRANAEAKFAAIAAGESHTIALDIDGAIWASGLNKDGQLGLGHTTNRNIFEKVAIDQKFVAIAAGDKHNVALDNGGAIWTSGANEYGQRGLGENAPDDERPAFETVIEDGKRVLIANVIIDDERFAFKRVNTHGKTIVAIGAGAGGSFAISSGGDVLASGRNKDGEHGHSAFGTFISFSKIGQLSAEVGDLRALYDRGFERVCDPTAQKPNISDVVVTAIAAGDSHTIALDGAGKAFGVGNNERGQLGLGDLDNRASFEEIASLREANVTAIAAGEEHTLALDANGEVWASGHNGYNQLGFEKTEDRQVFAKIKSLSDVKITAIAVGAYHSFALDIDGKVWASGRNNRGQLGMGDSYDREVFTEVESLKDKVIAAIAVGAYHSFALDNEGKVWASGANDNGQLGVGGDRDRLKFAVVNSLNDKNIVAIAAGENFSLALGGDGAAWAVGSNEYGQLGLGASGAVNRASFTKVASLSGVFVTAIAVGDSHALALSDEGGVYAAGLNENGQLGFGDLRDRLVFTAAENLEGKTIALVAAGEKRSVLLSADGRLWSSGQNYYGQLGLGDTVDRAAFTSLEPTGCAKKFAKD